MALKTRTFLFDIFIEDDVPGIFHKLTSRECTIECVSDRGVVTKVIWTKNLFESISDDHEGKGSTAPYEYERWLLVHGRKASSRKGDGKHEYRQCDGKYGQE